MMQEAWLSHLRYVSKTKNPIFKHIRSDTQKWRKMPIFGTQVPKIGIFWSIFDDRVRLVECKTINRLFYKPSVHGS